MSFLFLLVLTITPLLFGLYVGYSYAFNTARFSAIKAGVAEYYLDVDNNKQFRFKECNE